MRKRLHGLLYDTNTAKKIADYKSKFDETDLRWYKESLYKKRTGEFFLAGHGQAESKYSETHSVDKHKRKAGENIFPLSLQEAKDWVETRQSQRLYDQLFGEIMTTNGLADKHIQISEAAAKKLARIAQAQKITQGQVIENLILNSDQ